MRWILILLYLVQNLPLVFFLLVFYTEGPLNNIIKTGCRKGSRWWSRKTLSSPPLPGTPRWQFTELSMKKTRTYQKIYPTTKDMKKEHSWDGYDGQSWDKVKTHIPGQAIHKWEKITLAEVLPKEQGMWTPYSSLQPGGPALGRWVPRTFGFEGQSGLLLGDPVGCEK